MRQNDRRGASSPSSEPHIVGKIPGMCRRSDPSRYPVFANFIQDTHCSDLLLYEPLLGSTYLNLWSDRRYVPISLTKRTGTMQSDSVASSSAPMHTSSVFRFFGDAGRARCRSSSHYGSRDQQPHSSGRSVRRPQLRPHRFPSQ